MDKSDLSIPYFLRIMDQLILMISCNAMFVLTHISTACYTSILVFHHFEYITQAQYIMQVSTYSIRMNFEGPSGAIKNGILSPPVISGVFTIKSFSQQNVMFTFMSLSWIFKKGRKMQLFCKVIKLITQYCLVLPIDIENPYRLSNCLYRYISIYIGFLATNF